MLGNINYIIVNSDIELFHVDIFILNRHSKGIIVRFT